jgi:DNA-binding transcriptional MerR regulator
MQQLQGGICVMFDDIDINLILKNIHSGEIKPESIPSIDLYMDQVITLFENSMSDTRTDSDDKMMTKTMINNYSKDKLIFPVKNKKYGKSHIIMLVLIYTLKQGLSMQDIKSILSPFLSPNEKNPRDITSELDEIYRIFLDLNQKEAEDAVEKFKKRSEDIINAISETSPDRDYKQLIMMILMLIYNANIQMKFAENLISEFLKKSTPIKDIKKSTPSKDKKNKEL